MLVERGAGIAFFVGRTVQLADHPDADALGARLQIEDFRHQLVGVGMGRHAHVDLGIGFLRDHVRLGAAFDDADIDGDAALEIVHRFQRLDDVAKFANGAAAVLGPRAGVRRHALDEDLETRDALAPGDDLAAVAGGLGHQHIFRLSSLLFDQRPRGRAADLFIGDVELGHAERGARAIGAKLPECMIGEIGAALHVVDAGPIGAVALDPERQSLDEIRADARCRDGSAPEFPARPGPMTSARRDGRRSRLVPRSVRWSPASRDSRRRRGRRAC